MKESFAVCTLALLTIAPAKADTEQPVQASLMQSRKAPRNCRTSPACISSSIKATGGPPSGSRGLVSLPVEFNLQGTLGFRFMVKRHWSVVAEGEYRHISNGTIKLPNFGIDAVGGNLGFGYFF